MHLRRLRVVSALVCILYVVGYAESTVEMMKKVANAFGTNSVACGREVGLNDDALNELYNFWNDDFVMKDRNVGCAIICMAKKHGIVTEEGKIHHENGEEFAKKHGAEEEMAKKLVVMLHTCEQNFASIEDHCARALEVAKCFKTECKKLNWMPDFQELVDEVMG